MRCRHGTFNNNQGDLGKRSWLASKAAEKHDRECPKGGGTFGHPGFLGSTVVCCSGCGKKVN